MKFVSISVVPGFRECALHSGSTLHSTAQLIATLDQRHGLLEA